MRTGLKSKAVQSVVGVCLMAIMIMACSAANGGKHPSAPPQIPPQSSLVMDFADFVRSAQTSLTYGTGMTPVSFTKSAGVNVIPAAVGDRSNWGYAALSVGFWSIVSTLGLAVPVASFAESFKHRPTQKPDMSWVWKYNVTVLGGVHTAELHGKYVDNSVRWEMHVSKQGEYSDFVWYYGESDVSATHGFWMLKDKPSDPKDLLRIDWRRYPSSNTGEIRYTNAVPGGQDNGGYISYSVALSKPYDRSYTIYNKGRNQTTYIEWNSTTKEGRVKDANHFRDENWHYWDPALINVSAP